MDRTSPAARNASDTEVIDRKLYCTLFIYLAYEYSKRFVQPVLQPVANCKRTFRRQCLSDCRATGQKSFPRSCERAKAVTSAAELRTTSCCLSVMLCHSAPLCNVLVCLCVCLYCEMWPGQPLSSKTCYSSTTTCRSTAAWARAADMDRQRPDSSRRPSAGCGLRHAVIRGSTQTYFRQVPTVTH